MLLTTSPYPAVSAPPALCGFYLLAIAIRTPSVIRRCVSRGFRVGSLLLTLLHPFSITLLTCGEQLQQFLGQNHQMTIEYIAEKNAQGEN